MGKLTFHKQRFIFFPDTADNQLAQEAKFLWDASTLRWETRSPHKAVKLRRFADKSAEQKFKKYFITDYEAPEQIIYPDHLEPKIFQIESAWHCITRSPVYCADEAGLGKTIMSILCMNSVPGNVLVICPPFLKFNWAVEIQKWCCQPYAIHVIEDSNYGYNPFPGFYNILILPDSLLTNLKIQDQIKKTKFTWLFVDEAHRYKEATTQRTIALVGKENDPSWEPIADCAERIVLLSGTPIPNGRPKELYPLLSRIAPEAIGHRDFVGYGKTFCGAKRVVRYQGTGAHPIVNWDFSGTSNLKQLRTELREKLMIRHLKKDVMKELGPKTRKIIFLDEVEKLKPFEEKILKNRTLKDLMGDTHTKGDIATYRREVGEAKINQAFLYISELLENSPDKLVVFAHHIEVVEKLNYLLNGFGSLMARGGMSAKSKAKVVHTFQTWPGSRVIIGNIEAMGVGNTLTKAPGVVFVEYDWRPGVNEQAEDRVHRMTQEQNTYFHYLTLRNSLDERMLIQGMNKQKAITQLMD